MALNISGLWKLTTMFGCAAHKLLRATNVGTHRNVTQKASPWWHSRKVKSYRWYGKGGLEHVGTFVLYAPGNSVG